MTYNNNTNKRSRATINLQRKDLDTGWAINNYNTSLVRAARYCPRCSILSRYDEHSTITSLCKSSNLKCPACDFAMHFMHMAPWQISVPLVRRAHKSRYCTTRHQGTNPCTPQQDLNSAVGIKHLEFCFNKVHSRDPFGCIRAMITGSVETA